ncbi:MAG TPA: zinc ABC transporter substrate-binding protein [Ktedonobacteraceae bacterium]|nr:zinc ABC transporter substrate-binding protein [Ktedonobacteraceae bacterium]
MPAGGATTNPSAVVTIVAAENFYGDIARQVGGSHVSVTSILSDPNVDPHQYESSVRDSLTVGQANIVIENGEGYDSWMDKLLAASPNGNRIVLVGSTIAGTKLPDNPHVWYDVHNMIMVAQAIDASLKKIDAAHAASYDQNLQTFVQSTAQIIQKMDEIKGKFAGTPVGLTEDIYLYQALPMGLNVLTPLEFQKAVAEGNDPPANTVVTANNQITQRHIKVLIYNEQTITPITTNLQKAAQQQHIPIVGVTETMPAGKTYQQWMLDQLAALEKAL